MFGHIVFELHHAIIKELEWRGNTMQIAKIQGSSYKTQSFNGRIIHTPALKKLIRRAMLAQSEGSTPINKMFQRIKKKLPQTTDLEISSCKCVRANLRFRPHFEVTGALKTNNQSEPLNFNLQKNRPYFTLKHLILIALNRSVLGEIPKFRGFLWKKFDQIHPKANRKTFFKEIMAANKRLNAKTNS